MDLSIIIVNYNTTELTRNCINSIISTSAGIEYEIILVDNASIDRSIENIGHVFNLTNLKCIFNTENKGFAKANNQGIKEAKGQNILLLNSDTIILDDCILKCLKFMDNRSDVGILGCKVLNRDGTLQYSCFHKPTLLTELIFFTKNIIKNIWDPISHFNVMKYWGHNKTREVDCVSGCFLWINKDILREGGFLDEDIFMYYEDTEYCVRIKQKTGYKICYFPFAEIIHLRGSSSPSIEYDYKAIRNTYLAAQYYLCKVYGPWCKYLFVRLCSIVWRIEISVFKIAKGNIKFNKKLKLLIELQNNNVN